MCVSRPRLYNAFDTLEEQEIDSKLLRIPRAEEFDPQAVVQVSAKNLARKVFRPRRSYTVDYDPSPDPPRIVFSAPPRSYSGPAPMIFPLQPSQPSEGLLALPSMHNGHVGDDSDGRSDHSSDGHISDSGDHGHDDGEGRSEFNKLQIKVQMSMQKATQTAGHTTSSSVGIAVQQTTNTSDTSAPTSGLGIGTILGAASQISQAVGSILPREPDVPAPSMAGFIDGAGVISMLDCVAGLHPFAKPVFGAVKMVYAFYKANKQNKRYVELLSVKIYATVQVLADLQTVTLPTDSSQLQDLVHQISEEIQGCMNSCDTYATQSKAARVLRGPAWQKHFSDYITRFNERRQGLQDTLVHYQVRVSETFKSELKDMRQEIQELQRAMEKSASGSEVQMRAYVHSKGGIKAIRDDDSALRELMSLEGGNITNKKGRFQTSSLDQLKADLSRDITAVISQNLDQFRSKMEIMLKQMDGKLDSIASAQDQILEAVRPGMYGMIENKDLQNLWGEISKSTLSVETSRFVRTLHEHYTQLGTLAMQTPAAGQEAVDTNLSSDAWALHLIRETDLQYIFDAFDEDGSGYVSLAEFNRFAQTLPQDKKWSLPQWLSYWCVGWHMVASVYRGKIHGLLDRMIALRDEVLLGNRSIVDNYLSEISTKLLCTTLGLEIEDRLYSDQVQTKFLDYATQEENRMMQNLKKVNYLIDGPSTVHIITDGVKMEMYLFILVYVLMRKHLSTILLAKDHLLHDNELQEPIRSLEFVFGTIETRVEELSSQFQTYSLDLNEKWTTFARGLYTYHHDFGLLWSTRHVLKRQQPIRSLCMQDMSDLQDDPDPEKSLNPTSGYPGTVDEWTVGHRLGIVRPTVHASITYAGFVHSSVHAFAHPRRYPAARRESRLAFLFRNPACHI
ncbi:hypothetical protein EIP91_000547 [Steccherinum ochraceum]|uniref:EF-hand domain-containing protein n=1 Tax=Steccherinum ochraceum TaxID=92696 RepID=A0A4R0S1D5_9APHY|nr:hypothetical protein EIP91_000547 [Steccherinum ochraceum]